MGKVIRLTWQLNLFLPCFGLSALYVLATTWPGPPARHHPTAVHKACPYMVMLPVRWWWAMVKFWTKTRCPPPLFLSSMLFIYSVQLIQVQDLKTFFQLLLFRDRTFASRSTSCLSAASRAPLRPCWLPAAYQGGRLLLLFPPSPPLGALIGGTSGAASTRSTLYQCPQTAVYKKGKFSLKKKNILTF